jgi:hypothetical protein
MPPLPSFSAVVEWENARLAGEARATEMLRILFAQSAELGEQLEQPPELIILFDRTSGSPDDIAATLAAAGASTSHFEVRIEAVEEAGYYSQKNIGANMASRDFVLFIDSDVLPEPGWLRALLGAARAGADVVGGDTYVDPATFYGRAFACFWFFPLRSATGGLRQAPYFFANNILFRRDLFLRHRFPDLPLYRGQCAALARTLRDHGVRIFIHGDARVCHPPPQPSEFAHRALCEGHDRTTTAKLAGKARENGLIELRRQLDNMRGVVEERASQLAMSEEETTAAVTFATAYARLRFAGARWTDRSPVPAANLLGIPSGRHAPFHCRNLAVRDIFNHVPQPGLRSPETPAARLIPRTV